MSYTQATLKTAIQDYLETDETTFVSQLNNIIENAEERIFKAVQIPNQRKNVQGSMTTNSRFLTTPTDFLAPFSLAVISSDTYSYLELKHNSFVREYAPNTTVTGKPKYYAIFDDNTFELAPIPDQDYVAEFHYLYKPASITVGDTSTETYLSKNAPDLLLYASLCEGAMFLKMDPTIYETKYQEALMRMKNMTEGRDQRDEMRYDSLRINVT